MVRLRGLIYKTESEADAAAGETTGSASGHLPGLAQDQDTFMVDVDVEARQNSSRTSQPNAPRHLREIVTSSTERWMLANDGADMEFYREMQVIGYRNEELDEMMQQRGREYHGMLRLGCKRYPQVCRP